MAKQKMQTNDKPEGTGKTRPAQAHGGVSSPGRHVTQLELPVNLVEGGSCFG